MPMVSGLAISATKKILTARQTGPRVACRTLPFERVPGATVAPGCWTRMDLGELPALVELVIVALLWFSPSYIHTTWLLGLWLWGRVRVQSGWAKVQ